MIHWYLSPCLTSICYWKLSSALVEVIVNACPHCRTHCIIVSLIYALLRRSLCFCLVATDLNYFTAVFRVWVAQWCTQIMATYTQGWSSDSEKIRVILDCTLKTWSLYCQPMGNTHGVLLPASTPLKRSSKMNL